LILTNNILGHKIALIENLGVTRDSFDSIDLSDNEIRKLESFPLLKRLQNLYLNNNHLSSIDPAVGNSLPNLETLILTNNYIRELDQLEPLKNFKNLKTLSLLDNLVTKRDNYRLYVINLIPSLKTLDFQKIKKQERERAEKFATEKEEGAQQVKTFIPGAGTNMRSDETMNELSASDIEKIKKAIENAKTIQEVQRYNEALIQRKMPKDLL
jgi:U2 small nuclear ribonucleoprotein A'